MCMDRSAGRNCRLKPSPPPSPAATQVGRRSTVFSQCLCPEPVLATTIVLHMKAKRKNDTWRYVHVYDDDITTAFREAIASGVVGEISPAGSVRSAGHVFDLAHHVSVCFSTFRMFVPSLSWKRDRLYRSIAQKAKDPFPHLSAAI